MAAPVQIPAPLARATLEALKACTRALLFDTSPAARADAYGRAEACRLFLEACVERDESHRSPAPLPRNNTTKPAEVEIPAPITEGAS